MKIHFDDRVLVVMTTAPAGLGHIRVMNALAEGLSDQTRVSVMGSKDPGLMWIHRLTSRNTWLEKGMEFIQDNRTAEKLFSKEYRTWLKTHADGAAAQLAKIVSSTQPQPETVLVLSTHFGMAHQLATMKQTLLSKLGVKLVVAVVVTDDSPQEMWAVSGADIIFVPSNTTREALLTYLMAIDSIVPEVVTIPYPISLTLGETLSEEELKERQRQTRQVKGLHLMVPISGAAVQLDYVRSLIGSLSADGVDITVVSRESAYSKTFLVWCREQSGVTVVAHPEDGRVVTAYEQEYVMSVFGAEVTKPSEQAFKALYTPRQRGGSVLLFSPPVGRQERDNLQFLRRHRLMPSVDDQARINEWCLKGNRLHITKELLLRAHHWRGVMLPADGMWAAVAIKRLVEGGILSAMADFQGFLEGHDEIRSDGVKDVWKYLKELT